MGIDNVASFSIVYFLTSWLNSCSIIKDKKFRKNAVYSLNWNNGSILKLILYYIAKDKMMKEKEFSKNVSFLIFASITTFGLSKDLLLIPLILTLAIIPRFIFKLYLYLNYDLKGKDMPSGWSCLTFDEDGVDPLRKF